MDRAAPTLEQIYRAHVSYVVASLRRLGVAERHLEDVAHDVFVAVHRKLATYDDTRPIRPWLFGFCVRARLDHKRLASVGREQLDGDDAFEGASARSPEDDAASSEARARVIRALAELSDEQRAVLVLHDLDEHPIPEVSRALAIPLNTAYSRLRLARRAFEAAIAAILTPRSLAIYAGRDGA